MNHKYSETLTFKIENETALHVEVVSFLKKRFPHSLFTATLGENQDTIKKRIDSWKKGYIRGSPDLIINNLHKHYTGFAIEFKSPSGYGSLSEDQCGVLQQYENNCFNNASVNSRREHPLPGNPRGFAPIFRSGPGDLYRLNCPGVARGLDLLSKYQLVS